MAEEATATEQTTEQAETQIPDGQTAEEAYGQEQQPEPFSWLTEQGLEEISEEDLQGYTEEEEPKEETEETKEESKGEETEDKKDGEEDTQKKAEGEDAETPPAKATEKPPKGYVPVQAVQEVRAENRYLKEQIEELRGKVENPQQSEEQTKEEFKVLSKDEFQELSEENPQEAMQYLMDLQEYKDRKAEENMRQQQAELRQREAEKTFQEVEREFETLAPGIFDDESPVRDEIVNFAESVGFTEDMFYLTNPATQVIMPEGGDPAYLGKQAASMFKFLLDIKDKVAQQPDEKKIEERLRPQIEAEVMKKIKSGQGGQQFKSLSDAPAVSSDDAPATKALKSEGEMARMSEKELEAYLAGY